MLRNPALRIASLAILNALLCVTAAPGDEAAGYALPLFDGQSLERWQVIGCEAKVEDDAILLAGGNGVVASCHAYADFVLELEWKALGTETWDSGIFFRCELPLPKDRPWPRDYQINLRKGMEGNAAGLPGAESKGLVRDGEWNHFKLAVQGRAATLEINGQPAWRAEGIERPSGYIALQAEVPGGGQFLFRNVRIEELGFAPLVNGTDLEGWQGAAAPAESCWKVEDGVLLCTGEEGTWLRSEAEYGDFNLRLEYQLKPGGNSGVYVRVPEGGSHHGEDAGIEVQILDDASPRYAELKAYQFTGSLYAIVPAEPRVSRPAGEWNTLEINCQGTDYRVIHNGVTVINARGADVPELAARRTTGFLGFQNHNEEVRFRNVRIGPPQP